MPASKSSNFCHHRTLSDDNVSRFGCVSGGSVILGKIRP